MPPRTQDVPGPRTSRLPALRLLRLALLWIVWAASSQAQTVIITAKLDAPRISVGSITILRIYAELSATGQDNIAQLARWRTDLTSSDPRVANGRFAELSRPASDGSAESSGGEERGNDWVGLADSLLLQPGAGMNGPVELIRVPVTAYAVGTTTLAAEPAPDGAAFTALSLDHAEISLAADWSHAAAQLEVFLEPEVTLPIRVQELPTFDLAGQEFTLSFNPAPQTDHVVEFLETPGGAWQPLPGAPHNSGVVVDVPAAATRFYRVRTPAAAGSPPRLEITYRPRLVSNGKNTLIDFLALSGWAHWLDFRDAPTDSWQRWPGGPFNRGWIGLPDAWPQREFRVTARPNVEWQDFDCFLVAGQSNGVLWDYIHPGSVSNAWKLDWNNAFIPHTRPLQESPSRFNYNFQVSAAEALGLTRPRATLTIPCAVGSTKIDQWMPGPDRFDRQTWFGFANWRRLLAAPYGLKAIWYYGHESNMTDGEWLTHYERDWTALVRAFRNEMGPVPFLYAQVAKHLDPPFQDRLHVGAEIQRLAETGQPRGLPKHHLVVTFDLPLIDPIHLSYDAQRILGLRFALATRQHVFGEPVNGTGPRLLDITHPNANRQLVRIRFDRPINAAVDAYDHQFRVFDSNAELTPSRIERDTDPAVILITLATQPTGSVSISYGNVPARNLHERLWNVVQDADGLPAPQFGPLSVAP